jgi:hypothetical protein
MGWTMQMKQTNAIHSWSSRTLYIALKMPDLQNTVNILMLALQKNKTHATCVYFANEVICLQSHLEKDPLNQNAKKWKIQQKGNRNTCLTCLSGITNADKLILKCGVKQYNCKVYISICVNITRAKKERKKISNTKTETSISISKSN